ncbi:HNH endonuclease [Kineosporia rhizophila]|uniref:HNH endonuclease signature motif containing protein n=1 Tax=Kineosporia rhizophila TaxID=84633 RepID=UPI001E527024|nr:HNH endonuclease [Kineosporia rhizophila]
MGDETLSSWPEVELVRFGDTDLLASILAVDLKTATENACLGVADGVGQLIRRISALQAQFLARAAVLAGAAQVQPSGPGDAIDGIDSAAAEVGMALALSRGEAVNHVTDSVHVYQELPELWAMVRAGQLEWRTVVAVHGRMREHFEPGSDQWRHVARLMAEQLPGKTRRAAVAAVQREIARVDPLAGQKRARQARSERCVHAFPLADGMGGLQMKLRAESVRMIDAVLDALADGCRDDARRRGTADPRTHQQRRADAAVAVFQAILAGMPLPFVPVHPPADDSSASDSPAAGSFADSSSGQAGERVAKLLPADAFGSARSVLAWWLPPALPTQQGRRPHLIVTLSLDALRGLSQEPGELQGHGAITAEHAREIARQAGKITLVPVPAAGEAAQLHGPGDQANCRESARPYKPRQTVVDSVTGRFQTCVHPGCPRASSQCDIDHAVPFAKGGRSCPCNLLPLCRFHHRLKTHGGWSLRLTRPSEPFPAGTIEFTSRLGQRRYEDAPPLPGSGAPWSPAGVSTGVGDEHGKPAAAGNAGEAGTTGAGGAWGGGGRGGGGALPRGGVGGGGG